MDISFEFFPPKTEESLTTLMATAKTLATLSPHYFSVTFGAGGSTREHTPKTVYAIAEETHIPTIPHIACMGTNREELLVLLHEYKTHGIKHLLVLRGDKPSGSGVQGDFLHANELLAFIRTEFNNTFHLTVSAYPEAHPESRDLETELHYFLQKIKCGADRAITQYFYNADSYFYFRDRAAKLGITTPIIPGIMPIINYEKLKRFSQYCGAEIPLWVRKQLDAYTDIEDIKRFGFDVTHRLCQRLIQGGAPGLHFYTLNMAHPSLELAKAIR